MMITMGTRQSLGLFVSPLNTSTGLGVANIRLALAVWQFAWGAVQQSAAERHASLNDGPGLGRSVRDALQDRSYLLLHAGFFTCGFHIAFLVTHLPGEVALCGLPAGVASWSLAISGLANIAGSLAAGWCVNRYRSKYVLFWMYGSRALLVLLYLA